MARDETGCLQALGWSGGQSGVVGTQEGQGGGSWGGLGFPEERTGRFYKRIFVGGGTVNFLGHLGPSGVSLWASFFLFLIYNYNIYEYINITNVCEHEADTHLRCWGQRGRAVRILPWPAARPPIWSLGKGVLQSQVECPLQPDV